jgi:hypothetical protein
LGWLAHAQDRRRHRARRLRRARAHSIPRTQDARQRELVRIVESVIVEARPGAKTTGVIDTTPAAKKPPEAAQGDVLQQLKAVVTIESVDLPTRMIVYKGGDNQRVQRQVRDPRLLDGLKAGDVIEITYTRERAIALQRQP